MDPGCDVTATQLELPGKFRAKGGTHSDRPAILRFCAWPRISFVTSGELGVLLAQQG